METPIRFVVDLQTVCYLKIEGPVYVTFPKIGPIEEVSVPFDGIDIRQMRDVFKLREQRAKEAQVAEGKAVAEWQEVRKITKRMAQAKLDLETEENDGET